jgi:hypothetical protein
MNEEKEMIVALEKKYRELQTKIEVLQQIEVVCIKYRDVLLIAHHALFLCYE